ASLTIALAPSDGRSSCADVSYSQHDFRRGRLASRHNDFEAESAFRAEPSVNNVPRVSVFRSFRDNKVIVATNARCPKVRTKLGSCRRHPDAEVVGKRIIEMAQRGVRDQETLAADAVRF